ncbi:hypothetical protein CHS0354_001748 [Potamilus streckersoni]|uniref:Uncharacterized protein n=1 Tax=Potamilus streckersoni TaxID=2493646 RepID=A0AAE0T2I3_9BIVA|nr:hypothetical protein CHS0354_001748 [Potamilus streckersoni]
MASYYNLVLKKKQKVQNTRLGTGQRERATYSEANRPSYWPEGIPFCSHSNRQDNGAGRVMTSSMMTSVLHSFKKHCLKKIYAGFIPINIASSNSMDEEASARNKVRL